jgi:hypothetical protein
MSTVDLHAYGLLPGGKTKLGWLIIAASEYDLPNQRQVIISLRQLEYHKYAVHWYSEKYDELMYGGYYHTIEEAVDDYKERCKRIPK